MADIEYTATDVAPVRVQRQLTGPAGAEIDAGEVVYMVAATGKWNLADENAAAPANAPMGVAISSANQADITITVVQEGIIDMGTAALDNLDYGDAVYLSDTAGAMADADPGNGIVIGRVIPGWGATTADKLLMVNIAEIVVLEVGS